MNRGRHRNKQKMLYSEIAYNLNDMYTKVMRDQLIFQHSTNPNVEITIDFLSKYLTSYNKLTFVELQPRNCLQEIKNKLRNAQYIKFLRIKIQSTNYQFKRSILIQIKNKQ